MGSTPASRTRFPARHSTSTGFALRSMTHPPERFGGIARLVTTTGLARLQAAHVCVVGVGGVGSHAAHMLARAGVRRMRLIDFDNVSLSSLNRHATWTSPCAGASA